jgi:hypothetical protein
MRILYITTGATVMLAACGYSDEGYNNQTAYNDEGGAYAEGQGNYAEGDNYSAGNTSYSASGGGQWPAGTRIVVDNGVTYRIEPGGARIALGPNDSRIVVENGTRFRVDPSGTRVRIDENGAVIDVDSADTDATVTVNTQ